MNIQIKSDRMDKFQVYYDTIGDKSWSEENSESIIYSGSNNMEDEVFLWDREHEKLMMKEEMIRTRNEM